jgi:hypothetical protein
LQPGTVLRARSLRALALPSTTITRPALTALTIAPTAIASLAAVTPVATLTRATLRLARLVNSLMCVDRFARHWRAGHHRHRIAYPRSRISPSGHLRRNFRFRYRCNVSLGRSHAIAAWRTGATRPRRSNALGRRRTASKIGRGARRLILGIGSRIV